MIAVFSFVFSFIAITFMLAVKNWEIKAGKTLFRDVRFKADRAVTKWTTFLKSHLPTRGRILSKELMHNAAYYISHVALAVVRFAERKLIRIINFIKGKGVVKKDTSASDYLKNVSEYERHPDRGAGKGRSSRRSEATGEVRP